MRSRPTTVLAIALGVFACAPAFADIPAVTISPGVTTGGNNITAGWRFSLNQSVMVTRLGFWDQAGDGLTDDHLVGIWAEGVTDSPLLFVTVPSGTSAALDGGFRWVSVTPYALTSGAYRIGAYLPGNADVVTYFAGVTESPAVDYQDLAWSASGWAYPGSTSAATGYFGPNFQYDPVPEPALLQLPCLLGFAGVAWLRTRRRNGR